jgi:uncharacterized membrane protein YdfJ with MMPL/SSD domain
LASQATRLFHRTVDARVVAVELARKAAAGATRQPTKPVSRKDTGAPARALGGSESASADAAALLDRGKRTSQAIFREEVVLRALADQPLIEVRESPLRRPRKKHV